MKRNDEIRVMMRELLDANPRGISTETLSSATGVSTRRMRQLLSEIPHVTKRTGFGAVHTAVNHTQAMLRAIEEAKQERAEKAEDERKPRTWPHASWVPPKKAASSVWDLGRI